MTNKLIVTALKTTLSEMNHGHCKTKNNAYYSGRTVVWELLIDGENTGIGFKTKKEAFAAVEFGNTVWIGTGDILGHFENFVARSRWTNAQGIRVTA